MARYVVPVLAVAIALLSRKLLGPATGTGAVFVLSLGAVRHGPAEASVPALFIAIACGLLVYLTAMMVRARRTAVEAEKRLRLANEAAGIFSWDLDLVHNRLRWGPEAPLGYAEIATVEAWAALIDPQDRDAFRFAYLHSLDPHGDRRLHCETRVRHRDGSTRWFAWTGRTHFSDGTAPTRQHGAAVEITERRRKEDERQVLVSLLENSSDFIGVADPSGKPIWVNAAGKKMVGLPDDVRVDETAMADYCAPEDRAFFGEVITRTMVEGGRWSGETYLRNWQTGQRIPVSDEAFAIRDPSGGRVIGLATISRDISEPRRIRDQLHDSEERFRLTIDEAPIGMALVALDGRFIRVNRSLCEIVGYTCEELGRMRYQDITHPEDLDTDVELAARLARGEIPRYQLEKRYIRKDGAIVTIMLNGSIVREPNGEPLYYIGQVEDITERKRRESELRFSEAQFSGIVSISADAIISVDKTQRITVFNSGAEKIFGYARSEVMGAPLDILIPERLRDVHRQHVAEFASGPVTARRMGERGAPIMGRRKNGEEFPADAAISRLEVDGRIILTVAMRDVSEQERRETEQRLLAEAGAVLFSSLDHERTLAAVGKLMVREFADWCIVDVVDRKGDLQRLKVEASDPEKASLCTDWERLKIDRTRPSLVRSVMQTRRPLLIEEIGAGQIDSFAQSPEHLRLLRALDARSILVVPLLIRDQLAGVLGFISSRRSYHARDLPFAQAVAERGAIAIENGRLYQEALRATHLREEVLGVVAHDLRNPVSAILLQSKLMVRHGDAPERRNQKPVELIQRAAKRMNRLIQDLLDVSMIEAGQLGIVQNRVTPSQLLLECAEAQRWMIESRDLLLRLDIGEDVPDVWADRDRLLQVLDNLLVNAVKFTPPQGQITLGTRAVEREVQFWVADTGCGIPPEGIDQVFARFWQARKRPGEGAGLGLAISRGIVEAHGGRIWIESTPGCGTTLFFTIPQAPRIETSPIATL